MDDILQLEKWKYKVIEWKINADQIGSEEFRGVRFGMLAFKKSTDGKYVDCMLSIYKLDFTLPPNTVLTDTSLLNSLYKWSAIDTAKEVSSISEKEIERFQNFFRYKTLSELKKEGKIDEISFTDLEEKTVI